jgi:hypothetical protein
MAHFAKIENNIVTKVIVAEPEFFNTFVDDSPGTWIQTSYNTRGGVHYEPGSNHTISSADQSKALRKNYAGIGYTYDKNRDAFIPPKPFNSWILNETTCLWGSPVTVPLTELEDNQYWSWNESIINWEIKTM